MKKIRQVLSLVLVLSMLLYAGIGNVSSADEHVYKYSKYMNATIHNGMVYSTLVYKKDTSIVDELYGYCIDYFVPIRQQDDYVISFDTSKTNFNNDVDLNKVFTMLQLVQNTTQQTLLNRVREATDYPYISYNDVIYGLQALIWQMTDDINPSNESYTQYLAREFWLNYVKNNLSSPALPYLTIHSLTAIVGDKDHLTVTLTYESENIEEPIELKVIGLPSDFEYKVQNNGAKTIVTYEGEMTEELYGKTVSIEALVEAHYQTIAFLVSKEHPDRSQKVVTLLDAQEQLKAQAEVTLQEAPPTSSTTEAPTSSTTEAPTSSTTEAPTSTTTEAPTSTTTEAPTSTTTEAPTSTTTEAPTSTTTEAPTSTTTEAPTSTTTEVPTSSTTEATGGTIEIEDPSSTTTESVTSEGETTTYFITVVASTTVDAEEVPEESIPLGNPTTSEDHVDLDLDLEEDIPLATLPKTGNTALSFYLGFGMLITSIGIFFGRKL